MADAAAGDRIDGRTAVALLAMALGVFVIANDITALSVALPQIESDFDADVSTIQWVVNAYALVFGILIVTGGRLADLFGRRRIFFLGAAIFVAFSLLGGAAQDSWWLIACRALMGIGGALMWPAILGMTYALLPASKAGLAGGLILGAAGFGNAMGPLIGGALTDALSWRWILFLNLPIAAFAVFVTWRSVHIAGAEQERERIDYAGITTLSLGLVALLLALDELSDYGLGDWRIIALLAVFVVLIASFVVVERRAGDRALVPHSVMQNRDFASACLAVVLMSVTFFAALLYLPQFMQKLLDYSALEAGLGLLPMMGTFAAVSFVAGPVYERVGPKPVVTAGAVCLALGMLLLSLVEPETGWGSLVPGMAVLGLGVGLFYSSVTTAAVTALDPSRSSLAGGIVYMCQIAGGSIGVGLTTAIFTSAAQRELTAAASGNLSGAELETVEAVLSGTESVDQVRERLSSDLAGQVERFVDDSFVAGFETAFRVDAGLALAGLIVTVLLVGGRIHLRRSRRDAAGEAASR